MMNRLFSFPTLLVATLLAGSLTLPADAVSTFTVANDAPTGPGSLFEAVSDASAVPSGESVEIVFDEVFFGTPRTLVLTAPLPVVRRSLTINGPALDETGAPRVVLSGDANGSGVSDDGDLPGLQAEVPAGGGLTVRRLAFAGFRSTATPGGAIHFRPAGPASLVLEECVFRGNQGRWGGAVAVPGSGNEASVRECLFEANRANEADGGALYLGTTPGVVDRCVFRGNVAPRGGAIFTVHGATELRGCFFEQNEALGMGEGGAVLARLGLRVMDCTFSANQARAGGALFLNQMGAPAPGATIENSTFSGNVARAGSGGAIYAVGTQAVLRHCTLTLNVANRDAESTPFASGGGIAVPGAANINRIELHNSVLAGNRIGGPGPADGADVNGPAASFVSLGGNLVGIGTHLGTTFSQPGDLVGSLQQPMDARLGALGPNGGPLPTHLPHPESPVIDIGVAGPGAPLLVDQRGLPRPGGEAPDAGAVELVTLGFPAWAYFTLGGVGATLPDPEDPVVLAPHQQPEADPDGDGVPNVLEYLSGGDPLAPSWSALTRPRYFPASGELGVRFLVAAYVVPGSVEVAFELSEALDTWSPVEPSPAASFVGIVGSSREMEVLIPGITTPTHFVRMTARLVSPGGQ